MIYQQAGQASRRTVSIIENDVKVDGLPPLASCWHCTEWDGLVSTAEI